jgi:hypothetical protein
MYLAKDPVYGRQNSGHVGCIADATFRISLLSPKHKQHSLHHSDPGFTITVSDLAVFYTMCFATITTSSHMNAFWF